MKESTSIQDVYVQDEQTFWAVANVENGKGVVFHKDEGTDSWVEQKTISKALRAIDCAPDNFCVAVGDDGIILKTTDGSTWSTWHSGITVDLLDVAIADGEDGVVVAVGEKGMVLRSSSKGSAWKKISFGTKKKLKAVAFANTTVGWIGGDDGFLLKTTNAGVKWKLQKSKTDKNINSVYPLSVQKAWIAGEGGMVKKTEDGGKTWSSIQSGVDDDLFALAIPELLFGVIAGKNGVLRATRDGGATWDTIETEKHATIHSIDCLGKGLCYGAGNTGILFPFDIQEDENEGSATTDESGDDDTAPSQQQSTQSTGDEQSSENQDQSDGPHLRADLSVEAFSFHQARQTVQGILRNAGPDTIGGSDKRIGLEFVWQDSTGAVVGSFSQSLALSLPAGNTVLISRVFDEVPVPPQASTLLVRPFTGAVIVDDPDQTNNTAVISRPLADLSVRDLRLTPGAISYTIKNTGIARAKKNFQIEYQWLDEHGEPFGGVQDHIFTLGTSRQEGDILMGGGTYVFSYPFTSGSAPTDQERAAGDYMERPGNAGKTLRVTVDSSNIILETDEINNSALSGSRPTVDVSLENVSFNRASQTVDATIKNLGPSTIGGESTKIGLQCTWLNGDETVGAFFKVVPDILGPGDSIRVSKEFGTIPGSARTLRIEAFPGSQLYYDPDTSNNMSELSRPKPDLTIRNLSRSGGRISYKIVNDGDIAAKKIFYITHEWLDADGAPVAGKSKSFMLGATRGRGTIGAGGTFSFSYPFSQREAIATAEERDAGDLANNPGEPGRTFRVTVDSTDTIDESDETDNSAEIAR